VTRLLASLRSATEALEERPFRLLWLGRTGSAVGDSLVGVALAFAVLQLTGSPADLGLVFAAFSLPRVVFTLVGGVWADRLPRQRLMVGTDLVRAAAQGVMAALLISGVAEVWHLFILAAVLGTSSAFFTPASIGLIPQLISASRLQQGNALMSLSDSGAHIFGPLLSGLLVAGAGPGWAFAIDSVSFLFSAAFLVQLRLPPLEPAPRRGFLAELRDGWYEVRSRTWVLAAILTFSLSNISMGAFQVLGPLVAETKLGGATDWGIVVTGGAVGGLLGGAIALRWKPRRPLIPAFLIMLPAQLELLMLIPPFPAPLLALGSMTTFAAIVISNTLWDTMLQQHIPRASIGRVSSYDWMVSLVFQPVAFAVVGPLAQTIGLTATLLLAAGIAGTANSAVLLVPSVRALARRDGEGDPVEPEDATAAAHATEPPRGSVRDGR
jgi:MFS family permease